MGLWWHWSELYAKASRRFDRAVELDPGFAWALCARASLLATCPDSAYRDGEAAVRDAAAAIARARAAGELTTNWTHRVFRETLAAALAERGDFEAAAEVEREALRYCIGRASPSSSAESAFVSTRVWCAPASVAGRRRADRGAGGAGGQERGDLVFA